MGRLDQLTAVEQGSRQEAIGSLASAAECCPTRYCRVDQLLISCSHSRQSCRLALNMSQSQAIVPVLDTLAGGKELEQLHIHSSGQCGYGRPASADDALIATLAVRNSREYCPSVVVRGPGVEVVRPGELRLNLPAPSPPDPGSDLAGFFLHALLPANHHLKYDISSWGCQGEPGGTLARVRVYNHQSWKASFSLGYRPGREKSALERTPGSWSWRGGLEARLGDYRWKKSFGGDLNRSEDGAQKLLPGLKAIFDQKLSLLMDLEKANCSLSIRWPEVSFRGSMSRREEKTGPGLEDEWDIRLSLTPLLGAEFRVDILDFLINSAHPYGLILKRIRDRLDKGIGSEKAGVRAAIKLMLSAGGQVGGEVSWRKSPGSDGQCSGRIEAGLRFGGEALVEAKGAIFIVNMAGQVSLKARSAESAARLTEISGYLHAGHNNGEPEVTGGLYFNGLSVYYTLFVNIGVEELRDSRPGDENAPLLMSRLPDQKEVKRNGQKRLFTLLAPWRWPPENGNQGTPIGHCFTS